MIQIGKASFGLYDGGCFTWYDDGTSWGAEPHSNDVDYRLVAGRLGYGDDTMQYCVEHDLCHNIMSELAFNRRSVVLWPLAHGLPVSLQRAVGEEALAQCMQRYLRLGERPIIGDVRWPELLQKTQEAIDALFP